MIKNFKTFIMALLLTVSMFLPSYSHTWFISEITEIAFPKAVMESNEPVVIWFYAGGTYGKLAEEIDKFAQSKSKVKILKMDKSLNVLTASKYKVKRHNTFIFFADGDAIGKTTSIFSSKDLDEFINHCLEDYKKILEEEKSNEWKPTRFTEDVDSNGNGNSNDSSKK